MVMNRVSLLLAWRYLKNTHNEQSISTMARLCFGGVFIGTFSLALVLSIMHGFEQVTHEKFRGIHAPIHIRALDGDTLNTKALIEVFNNEFPEIAAYSPTDTQQVIIQSNNADTNFTIVALKGVVPALESALQTISKNFVPAYRDHTFIQALSDNHIILGKKLAQELKVTIGDSVTLLYAREEQTRKQQLALDRATAQVGGIFDSGIDEFDSAMAICSLDFLQTLFDTEATHVGISLKAGSDEQKTIDRLAHRSGLEVFSWKDLYPALVSALKLEKYAMFLILALITLVASMNIISLLFMQITHKRGDIAILKAMGMPDNSVKTIFILMGTGISFIGSLFGLIAAYIVGFFLDRYPLITLPDAYYVTHLPIHMTWSIVGIVAMITLVLGFLATWIPVSRIGTITIAKVLRMEA